MVFSKSLLSAETFERVCLKAREINSKEKCLFKMCVLCGHSGPGFTSMGRGASQRPGRGPPGVPQTPGVDFSPGGDLGPQGREELDSTCGPPLDLGAGRGGAAGREGAVLTLCRGEEALPVRRRQKSPSSRRLQVQNRPGRPKTGPFSATPNAPWLAFGL